MKSITIELPDEAARLFEAMPNERKTKAALLATLLAQAKTKPLSQIFEDIDKRVSETKVSENEIDRLLGELS